MTAESTVPPPAGQQPRAAERAVSVLAPRRRPVAGRRLPAGRRGHRPRRASWLPLALFDGAAALVAALVVPGALGQPLVIVLLALGVLALNRRARLYDTAVERGVLDELPALCGRIAVGWAGVAALTPLRPLPLTVLGFAFAVHCAAACAGRAAV
ncbi:transferase, partial [Streptomyces sp. KC 17012]|nr:transferase [Streptomyces plumbidurans]